VCRAQARGLDVAAGHLAAQEYPSGTFDAVTLIHVLEHVANPSSLLAECCRILKPGGRLVVVTPNFNSLGRRVLGEAWRGLEPPRHLILLTRPALHRQVAHAGFCVTRSETVNAPHIIYASLAATRPQAPRADDLVLRAPRDLVKFVSLSFWESILISFRRDAGEQIVIVGQKA
jgi:SAM-dependent methyltransferase